MNKKKLMIVMGFIFVLAMILLLSTLGTISAQGCRIIKIQSKMGQKGTIMVEPGTALISKGDCVVWFNRFPEANVKVTFEEGKRCVDQTKQPTGGWNLNEKNCYVASWIPFTGTSDLRFMEKGTYKYVVNAEGMGDIMAEGKIVVK